MNGSEFCIPGPCPTIPLNTPPLDIDPPQKLCDDPCNPTQRKVDTTGIRKKYKLGVQSQCDPYLTGQVREDLSADPNRRLIYRQPRAIRSLTEGMIDLFSNVTVQDEFGAQHPVPIFYSARERAVEFVVQDNIRSNSTVVDRVTLPLMSIYASSFAMNWERYTYHWNQNFFRNKTGRPGFLNSEEKPNDTAYGFARGLPVDIGYQLNVWTYFVEDIYQIVEQIILKFSQLAYIRTQGNQWITAVKLDGIEPNIDLDPGNTQPRMVRFQINMTAEHYIPQAISKYKTVLKENIEFANSVNRDDLSEVYDRLIVRSEND